MAFGWSEVGNIGDILGGIGTSLAFGATIWLIKRETDDRRMRAHDEERRIARLVYASLGDGPAANHLGSEAYETVHVEVVNQSDEPIFEARVFVPALARPLWIDTVAPRERKSNARYDVYEGWHLEHLGPGCPGTPASLNLEVVFRDNRGILWRRTGYSEPIRLRPTDDPDRDWLERVLERPTTNTWASVETKASTS
jgi:hypothetical protein